MKTGMALGLVSAIGATLLAAYCSLMPVIDGVSDHALSSHQAGLYFAATGIIVGLSGALIGLFCASLNTTADDQ